MPIPALNPDMIQRGLAGILDGVDDEQAQLISAGIVPAAVEVIKILLDTLKQAKKGLPCDTQMLEAQKIVKTLYDVTGAATPKESST